MTKRYFNSRKAWGGKGCRSSSASAQASARMFASDKGFGMTCNSCGQYDHNVAKGWKGAWNCDDCGGNIVSKFRDRS